MAPSREDAVDALRAAGFRLEVVTSRPESMRASTELLLDRLFRPGTFAAKHFVPGGEKGRVCRAINAVVLIDDQARVSSRGAASGTQALEATGPRTVCGAATAFF